VRPAASKAKPRIVAPSSTASMNVDRLPHDLGEMGENEMGGQWL